MKIGLIDVDGHNFPNLALMKISAYEKQNGNSVEWCIPMKSYDRVYMSKVFTFTNDFNTCINAKEIIRGGSGYDLKNKLPDAIEKQTPDYTIYKTKEAYGFLTRGCPRKCKFCIVSEKEGCISKKVADLNRFWNGEKEIKLLDPNILACKDHLELLDQLIKSKANIDITQGLDCRLLTDDNTEKIKKLKLKMLHFAWDNEKDSDLIIKKLEKFKKDTEIEMRKTRCYVLVNFDTTFKFDLERVEILKKLDYDPYVMIYNKDTAEKKYKRLQRWVNNKFIFRSCESFEKYAV